LKTQKNYTTKDDLVVLHTKENEYIVKHGQIMEIAIDVMELVLKFGKIYLKAKGEFIPNAVSIANIITENYLKNTSRIEKINLDSEFLENGSKLLSTIEIILLKS
tara:strand:- start:619 stop:933 length:315 start_codon:yes stop_codon:yes gene_type:complete